MTTIETLPNGARLIKRYRNGRCYASVWSPDFTDRQIMSAMAQGEAAFFPYNESTGEFMFNGKVSHFLK